MNDFNDKNLEKIFRDMMKMISNQNGPLEDKSDLFRQGEPHIHSSFISYKFDPTMEKPEIKVRGDMPPNLINDLFKMMGGGSNVPNLPLSNPIHASNFIDGRQEYHINLDPLEKIAEKEEPYYEIQENGNMIDIYVELFEYEKEDISLHADTNSIDINGFTIQTPVPIQTDDISTSFTNGILTIHLRKNPDSIKKQILIE